MTQDTTSTDHYRAVAELHTAPLWRNLGDVLPAEPRPTAVAHRWRYADLRPHLLHFLATLGLDEAERRVLMLVNPGLTDPPATTTSLYAGLQVIGPRETAQAHRHASHAFRFVIEGGGAATTVNGERVPMRPGDLLLTPGGHWHDHEHTGDEPVIWLDALDYPLVNALDASYFEWFERRSQPHTVPDDLSSRQYVHGLLTPAWGRAAAGPSSPVGRYPWAETRRAFDAIADDAEGSAAEGVLLEYRNPLTGGPVLPTMSCRVTRLRPGFSGVPVRRTSGSVLHVVSGEGTAEIGGVTLDWADHDVIAVPPWAPLRLRNTGLRDAYLFGYTNEPVLRALDLYREEEC
ncbi:cupin domain-containing protein [Streptomyces spongiae]|uniref:Cupin domain-containing protein n=1 Tax=Streptomyces spongiae TaxID=565072 RepID=A0A5N8X9N5_9ACTN|nr:cupin domain-containing protein [Streptomyces spongiae]MPY56179.1 cupin domain-containing protein [Streptomyces spongiae]